MNLVTAMAQVNLVDCFSAADPFADRRSADRREWRRWIKEGQEGEDRYTLI
jgi:hypothetical protein